MNIERAGKPGAWQELARDTVSESDARNTRGKVECRGVKRRDLKRGDAKARTTVTSTW